MPEPKYNYLIRTQEGQTFSIPEEEYERNKEKIFAKNPAGVWREQAWDANQQTNEWDNYAVTTSDGHQFAIDAAKFGSTRDKLFEKDPNAKVTRYSPIKWVDGKEYDAQSAADAEAKKNAFFGDNGAKLAEYEQLRQEARQYDAAMDGGVSLLNTARKQVTGDYSAYESLRKERDAVLAEYFNNPFIREREERKRDYQEQMRKQADDMVSQTSGVERRHWRRAREMHKDAYNLLNAPNAYVKEVDGNNGFVKFFKSYGKGMGDTFSDRDFWSMGLTETSRNFDLRKIQRKLEKAADDKGSELTEADIDSILSQAEKAELDAWAELSLVQADRASTLSGAYRAGQGSAESLYFMAQFLLTQGAGNAIGKGLAKSTNALASYIGRSLMTEQALQRAMNPVTKGMSAVRAAEAMNTAADITKNVVAAEKAVQKAGKVGGALLKFGDQAIARPVIQGTFHTFFPTQLPGLLQNISQKALETGGSDGIVPGHPEEGRLIGIGKAIGNGVLDYFIENWSESMGGAFDLGLARGIENWGGSFGKIARWIHEAPTTEVLVSGGFNGLIGEMSEEWMGNAARMAFGLMSKEEFGEFGGDIFSKDKNKRDKAVESQLEMAASFGPMSLIGLGGSIRGARSKSKEYAKQRTKVEDILRSHGVTDDELKDIFNKNFDSTKEVAQKLSGYVESIVSADISDEQKASEYKEVLKLADLIGQSRTLAGLEEQQTKYDRTQMRQSISASAGRFWQSHKSEAKDKNGEPIPIEQVRVVTLADGRRMYAIDNMEDGGVMAIDEATGEIEFISKDRLDSDEVTSDREMMLDDYLDERVKETKDSEEAQRMETERRQQLQHVKEEARSRGSINLGTEESPLNARIVAETAEGVILEYTDANGQAVQQSTTWTDVANRIGMPINVKTDEQLDEELAGRMDSADARARQYKGIIPGTRLTASLETGDEGQTEEVGFSFESAYNDGGVVMLRGTDENGNPIEFSEEQVTNLDEALNGSRVDLSDTQEVGKAVRWADKDGVEHSGTIYREDDGNGVTLVKYGDGVITDVRTADIIDDTQAPVQEEHGAQDNTPRDFRGNPLPLKDDGSVDQKSLWNSDPEAWVRWNDAKREDGGANSSAYVQGAISRLTEQRQQKQEQYDAESDFDRRDAIEAELREMDNRLGALNAIQQEYARKAEQEQEQAPAQQEETAPEATGEAAPAQETPTAPEGVPTHEQAGFESLEALEQSIEEEAASSQTPLSLEEETARIEAMAGELYNGQDNGQQTELDVHPDAEGVSQVPGVGGQAAQAGVAESAREGEAVRDSDRIDDAGRDASGLRDEGNEVSGNAVPLDTVQGNDALAAERQPADAGGSAGAEGAPVVDEAAGVQGAEQNAPAEAGAEGGVEVSDEVGTRYSKQEQRDRQDEAIGVVTGRTKEQVKTERQKRRIRKRADKWKKLLGDTFQILESEEDIDRSDMSDARKAEMKQAVTGDAKAAGWYFTGTGKAYLYLPNIKSEGEVDMKVIHEVLSHKGLRGLLGDKAFDAVCDSVWEQMSEQNRAWALGYVNGKASSVSDRRAAADEYIAHVVEEREELKQNEGTWKKIVARVKEILNDMLGEDRFSVSDRKEDDIDMLIQSAMVMYIKQKNGEKKAKKDAVAAVEGGMETKSGDSPVRFSYTAQATGAGFTAERRDSEGNVCLVGADGKVYNGHNHVTADDIRRNPNCAINYMLADAKAVNGLSDEMADIVLQKYADMLNLALDKGLAENGGFDKLSDEWQWVAESVFRTVSANSDEQYSYSLDITRVCKKNEAVIKAISEVQRRVGYGVTPGQVMDIYLSSIGEGYQVPCPVCYVFSRYINNGQYATISINGQRKYGSRLVDPRTLSEKERAKAVRWWAKELNRQDALNEKNDKAIKEAKADIASILELMDAIGDRILRGKLKGEERRKALNEIKKLDRRYRRALNVVSQASLGQWIKNFAIQEKKGGVAVKDNDGKVHEYVLYEDSFQGFPPECALDLRLTAETIDKYPAVQRLRKAGGSSVGKEIHFESDNALGDVPMLLGSSKSGLLEAPNYYQMAAMAESEKERKELLKKARKRFADASKYARQQSLRGGQRMWSWSDNIERLSSDVFVNLMQLQLIGGSLQSYTKQLEGAELVARMGGYVNGSLMGKGDGWQELSDADIRLENGREVLSHDITDVVDEMEDDGTPVQRTRILAAEGSPVYTNRDGKKYTLLFDDVIGIAAYGKMENGVQKKGLFDLNGELDKAGNILVGMNDIHVRAAMADPRVFFIIPWHRSGLSNHILAQMLSAHGVDTRDFKPQDYTNVQEEHNFYGTEKDGSPKKVPQALVDFWESHKNESDYACGLGTIPSGRDGVLSDEQKEYKRLRDAILLGEELAEEEQRIIDNDVFLSQVQRKVRENDLNEMTNGDTKFVYPYEYWNEDSTIDTADENGMRYLEYCRRLGIQPKFIGTLAETGEDYGNFADDPGYWKLLIDRRMYDTNGNYQDITAPVSVEGFSADLIDPEKTGSKYAVTRVAKDEGIDKIADETIRMESARAGSVASVNYDQTLEQAVKAYEDAKDYGAGKTSPAKRLEQIMSEGETRFSFAGVTGALTLDKANLESVRMDNLETAKAMEETGSTPKEIKMATGWEKGKDDKWRYEVGDAIVNSDVFGEMAYIQKTGETATLADIIDTDSEVMRAYPQLADVKVTAKTVKGEYGSANRNANTINLSRGEIEKSSDPVKTVRQTINHEIQHFIQGYEGFAVGANSGLNVNNSESLAKAKEETPLVYGFIRYFGGTSAARLINSGAQNARTSLSNYVAANNIVGEDLEMARALARELAHMEPDEYGKLVRDSKALLKKAKKEANDNYRKSAGEVEARNAAVRMPLNAEQRRILTAEETEDVAREEQMVRFSKVTDRDLIAKLDSGPKIRVYRSAQFIPDPNGNVDFDLGDGNGLQKGFLYAPMSAKVDGRWRDPISIGEWEQADENPELANDNGEFVLDKGNGDKLTVAYAPYLHTRRSPLNEQFSGAYERGNLVILESEIPESELTSGYTAEKSKKSTGEHDWPSGKVSNALAKEGMDTRKVILSRWAKPIRVVPNSEVADMISGLIGDRKLSFPYNVVTPGLRRELQSRGVKFSGWQGNKPKNVNEIIAGIKEESGEDVRFSITPEQDREYMDAVEAGDMETVQRLVDQAARFAFPNSTVRDGDGNLLPVYHDTNSKRYVNRETGQDWESLDWEERDAWEQRDDWDQHWEERDFYTFDRRNARTSIEMPAFFFATEEDPYHEYGERTIKAYINLTNPVIDPVIENAGVTNTAGADAMQKYIDEGYDGFVRIDEDGKPYEYGVFDANNIKSAEPVTYDDNGDVIPLSERFNPEQDDIRFSKANNNQRVFISNAEAALDGIQQQKATPEQWLKMLEGKGGLKAGEDKWLGLSDWIRELDKKTLTKQEIADYIAENRIQIEEVKYAEDIDMEAEAERNIQETIGKGKSLEDLQAEIDEIRDSATRNDLIGEEEMDQFLTESMAETYGDDFKVGYIIEDGEISYDVDPYSIEEDEFNRNTSGTRKISFIRLGYTTEGLDNKREIALTVPTIESWNEDDQIHFGDAGEGRAVAWIRFGDATVSRAKDDAKKAYEEADKAFRDYQHELKNKYALKATGTKSVRDLATDEENARLKELYLESNQKFNDWKYGRHARERVLVIDEIQSKRHQDAREKGYKLSDERRKELFDAAGEAARRYGENPTEENLTAMNDAVRASNRASNGIPAAPFEKNWHELAMKRMLRLAAEEGYDYVAWTTGEQQAERYNLGNIVGSIDVSPWGIDENGYYLDEEIGENGRSVFMDIKNKDRSISLIVDKEGNVIDTADHEFRDAKLSDIVGKDLAAKILSADGREKLSGDNLRIGGEGMKGFYDEILPRFMNKYGKKWGVKVDDMFIDGIGEGNTNGLTMHAIPVNEAMKESVMEGQVMFSKRMDEDYMKAVESGDMELAGEMVREVARIVMPDTKVVDENETPLIVRHATDYDFNIFNREYAGKNTDGNATDEDWAKTARLGFWFNDKNPSKLTGQKREVAAYLDIKNPAYFDSLEDLVLELSSVSAEEFVERLKDYGYDGISVRDEEFGGNSYVAFDSNQIKSADPVTYDDEGKVIPLSERFNTASEDIRFSRLSPVSDALNSSGISLGNPDAMKEYHLSALNLSKHGDVVTLSRIVAEKPGRGEGTRLMEDLAGLADRNGWTLALTPDDSFGATSVSRLKKFYKRFGFKENKGRETDYSINESMIRRPAGDNGENALTRRKANADAVAAVDRDGITGLVGEENELDFYKSIVDALPSELRRGIMNIALTNGFDIKEAAKEYIAAKAAMGSENDPTGELALFSNILRYYTENGELMDDSTARYALWKSGQESGVMTDLASAANKNRWGVGREEDDEVRFSKGDLSGDIAATRAEISNVVEDAATEKTDKRRALTKDLLTAARAMAAQKEYDQKTVDLIVNTAKTLLKDQGIDKMTRMEVSRLLGIVRTSVGKSQDAVRRNGDALVDVVLKHLVRSEGSMFSDLLKIKAGKVNASGVEVQGVLDVRGQNVLRAVKEGMKLQLKKDGEDAESNDGTIEGALLALETRLDSTDDAVREAAEDEALGYELAKDYIENIRTSEQEEARLKSDLADAEEAKRKKELSANDFAEFRKSVNESLRENAIDRIEAYRELRDKMIRFINGSKEAAMEFREREKARKDEIRHLANSDMQGRDTSPFRQETRTGRLANSAVARFFTAPLATFDQMLRLFGEKHIAGEGYLWNKFMRQWTKSSEDAWNGQAEAREELDKKVSEVFGKDMIWADLYAVERKMPKATVTWWDGGEMREHELTQGNLLYIYMVNKMADGRMKLRRMGITEEKVKEIERQMDSRFLELANWVQDEFLVNKRNKYNEVHKRLFGASMASIEDYFPLRVNKRSLHKQEDIATPENNGQMNSTTTGAIKKRIKNSNDLDLLNADAFSVVIEHVDEMEQWAAFAEFNRDLNTLLSDRSFRNKVMNMTTVYGAGQKLWDNFKKVCQIAGNQYKPVVGEFDRAMVNLAKGVTGAKISFRVYTAIKQFLSMPAFVSDANLVYLAKNAATPWKAWKWAMENLPLVEKRWMSRIAGDTRLMDTESDWKYFHSQIVQKLAKWGMSPNAFVDAVTVSIGAYSMYQSKYDRYIKDGYSEEEADKRAKQDATILYNETQQSSEGAFTAAVQVERTAQATAFTVFRNSSMGYQRQLHDALRNLGKHFKKGYREESIEFMTKQMVRDGLDEEQAREAATRRYNRSYTRDAVRVATFGFLVQFAWNLGSNFLYVLFGDDDDERKKMLKNDALHALYGGWAEGLAGGNIISEFLNMKYVEKSNLYGYNPELMPIVSDIKRLVQMWDSKPVAAYNELFNLGTQALSGVNPQTLTDAIVAVVDACNGDLDTSKEAMLLIMRIINAPQSQVDNFIIDELGIGMDEAKKLPYDEIARRYARYKVNREAPITGPILYSDEERKAMEDKKITGNSGWKQKIKERQELHNKQ